MDLVGAYLDDSFAHNSGLFSEIEYIIMFSDLQKVSFA